MTRHGRFEELLSLAWFTSIVAIDATTKSSKSPSGGILRRGTAPWTVERVELREAEQAVQVFVEAAAGTGFIYPDCGTPASVYYHAERRWRYLHTCQFTTVLVARVRSSAAFYRIALR